MFRACLLVAFAVFLVSPIASAQDQKAVCAAAFTQAQESRSAGKWVDAKKSLIVCAASTCPDVVSTKCNEWLEELDKEMPTITVQVKRGGTDVAEARVLVDGVQVAERIDGKPIAVDPGSRSVQVVVGAEQMTQNVVVVAAEKARSVLFELSGAGPPPPGPGPLPPAPEPGGDTSGGGGISLLVWVGYGVALAGIVVGGVTGGLSLSKSGDIEDQCTDGACPPAVQDDIDSGTTLAHVSTISFAVAGAGLVLGTIGLFLGGGGDTNTGVQIGPGHISVRGAF